MYFFMAMLIERNRNEPSFADTLTNGFWIKTDQSN